MYLATVAKQIDYYPFGMIMDQRSTSTAGYRYCYNGKENDNKVMGEGNQQDYGFRIYDPRVARFLSVDPLAKDYAMLTVYQFASNTPIQAIDLDGAEAFFVHGTTQQAGGLNISNENRDQLKRIAGNTAHDLLFRWHSPINNSQATRTVAARQLVFHIIDTRNALLAAGRITNKEPISIIGYSHGGNVAIQAAQILFEIFRISVNVVGLSTPAKNFGREDPEGKEGVHRMIQIVHENDRVVYAGGGVQTYSDEAPHTINYIVPESVVPLTGGVESHTDLPFAIGLVGFLRNIPSMPFSPTASTGPLSPSRLSPSLKANYDSRRERINREQE